MVGVAIGRSMIIEQAVAIDNRGFGTLDGTPRTIGEPMAVDRRCSVPIGAIAAQILLRSKATVSVQLDFKLISMGAFLNGTTDFLGLCLILRQEGFGGFENCMCIRTAIAKRIDTRPSDLVLVWPRCLLGDDLDAAALEVNWESSAGVSLPLEFWV